VYRLATGLAVDKPRQHALLNAAINRLRFDSATERFVLEEWANVEHLAAPPAALGSRVT
jgi:hypothetical protein